MSNPKLDILLIENFLLNADNLFKKLQKSVDWDTSMVARYTASFGEPYNYSQMKYDACPLHASLIPVARQLKEQLKIEFNNCLLNYYLSGNSTMGFHSDDTSELQPDTGVAIISLGSERYITYRCKSNHDIRHTFKLPSGSMLYMDFAIQDNWMHAIKKQSGAGPRISLTWRAFQKAS